MIALQRCTACGHAQYPPRAVCESCLSDRIALDQTEALAGTLLARTVLHHSQEARFRAQLPLGLGLVKLESGPVVLCFVPEPAAIGESVAVRQSSAGLEARTIRG